MATFTRKERREARLFERRLVKRLKKQQTSPGIQIMDIVGRPRLLNIRFCSQAEEPVVILQGDYKLIFVNFTKDII